MDKFEQSDLEKEADDSHNTCYQNAFSQWNLITFGVENHLYMPEIMQI